MGNVAAPSPPREWRTLYLPLCLGILFLLNACGAGDGSGLTTDPGGLAPTIESLQDRVFGPICGQPGCHRGSTAPFGLSFETASSTLENTAGIPSRERADLGLDRISPGDPDGSYLVWKIEGRPEIEGGRMPLGLPALSGEEISAIRAWIEDGAQP